jgi:Tfp pilus assembly protein PilX
MRRFGMVIKQEDGFVSLFSTIFFMLLVTVITLGFIQITATEQQQALNNDLSASALASAQSGIEDGKRAVLKYVSLTNPTDRATYYSQMTAPNSSNCNSITGSQIGTDLGLSTTGNVVNNAQINQAYSCLTINLHSPDFLSESSAGKSQLVPLRAVGNNYQQIRVSWHLLSATVGQDGDGLPGATPGVAPYYAAGPLLYPANDSPTLPVGWSELGYPAYLRVQLYGYPSSGSFTRNDLTQRSRSALLVPAQSGTPATTPINLGTVDPNPGAFATAEITPRTIQCQSTPASNLGTYACTALLELPTGAAFASTANTYFLRVTPIYGATHFRVALVNGGSEVNFDQVQPIVDATGRAADVFRRIQARVMVNAANNYPEFAAEVAGDICKNMQVSASTADYVANNCP